MHCGYGVHDSKIDMQPAGKLMVKIREINPHIVCSLCAGYFVDATTLIECLHTFCKSCIVKYLQTSVYCPTCNTKVHETHPLTNIRLDRTLQDIVRNIVPWIAEDERKRKIEFYTSRGLKLPFAEDDSKNIEKGDNGLRRSAEKTDFSNYRPNYREDEQISLCVDVDPTQQEFEEFSVPTFQRRYLRCSVRAKCGHLVKLLQKLIMPPDGFKIDIKCNGQTVSMNETMKFVWLGHWKRQKQPMDLIYRFEKTDL